MRRSRWSGWVVAVFLASAACGGSGDSSEGGTPGGDTGGQGGSGGSAGKGTAGSGGGTSGAAGKAGSGGTAGAGGTAGQGGDAGAGGSAGSGGASGSAGDGGTAGDGGSGGASGDGGSSGAAGSAGASVAVCCTTSGQPGCDGLAPDALTAEQKLVQECVCANVATCCSEDWSDECVLAIDTFQCGPACAEGPKPCVSDAGCDDGVFCNGVEACQEGKCVPGSAPSCDDGIACTDDFCDQGEDACRHNKSNATCDDGKFCNGAELCDPGSGDPATGCVAGTPVVCDDGIPCTQDACDDDAGACVKVFDHASCSNGVFCDGQEQCTDAGCVQGPPEACDDGLSCTVDSCDEGSQSCLHTPNHVACDDGLVCDGVESCDPANGDPVTGCAPGTPIPCGSDGVACTVDACNEATGKCEHKPDNALCAPGQFCIPGQGSGCVAGTPCNNAAQCDDGNDCNGKEICDGVCKPGAPKSCDDGIACTVDSCNAQTGACEHTPNNTSCDNGLVCDGKEVCDTQLGCIKGAPVNCNDGLSCTLDVCQEPGGTCLNIPVDSLCNDGKLCNGVEVCDPATGDKTTGCKAGQPHVCPSDNIACTNEVCDPVLNACVSKEDNSKCPCGQTCSASKGGCGNFCEVKACSNGKVYACGDCIDNDGDCKVDSDDPQCLGPCDNTENAGPTQGSGCYFSPPPGQFNPVQKCAWNGPGANELYPAAKDGTMTPVVLNLTDDNGDGKVDTNDIPDIAFIAYPDVTGENTKGVLRVLSGKCNANGTMKQHWAVGTNEIQAQTGVSGLWFDFSGHIAAGDIDGDGVPDLVATLNGGGTIALSNTGKVKWLQQSHPKGTNHRGGSSPSLANLDGAGDPEVITGRVVLNAKTGALKWTGTAGIGVNGFLGPVSSVADIDLDGKLEVLAGNTAYRHDGTVLWTYARVTQLSNTDNCAATNGVCDGFTAAGNFDNDDQAEVVIVSAGRIFLVNHDGTPVKVNGQNFEVAIPVSGCTKNEGGPPTIADFDGDGKPEIGVAGSNFYVVADLKCFATPKPAGCSDVGIRWKVANADCSSRVTGSSVFDFDGDGNAEVIYNDEQNFRIFDGRTGAILFQKANKSRTRLEMPIVVDADNDGKADVIFVENDANNVSSTRHGLRVWGDATNSWVATRRIWNQHSYHVTNITEAGLIPLNEKPNWLEPTTSTVSGRMNNFRQNLPEYDALAAPDLSVSLSFSTATCPAFVQISAKVCNKGLLKVPSGVPVRFYDEATKAEIACVNGPASTSVELNPNECSDVLCNATGLGTGLLRACVDNVGFDCLSGGSNECVEENNSSVASGVSCPQL